MQDDYAGLDDEEEIEAEISGEAACQRRAYSPAAVMLSAGSGTPGAAQSITPCPSTARIL